VALALGDLYREIGLAQRAEGGYLNAAALAAESATLDAEARAQRMLGTLYGSVLGNPKEAEARLRRSIELYKRLGDTAAIIDLEKHLSREPQQ
jgi:tetratricopeptide (TPR) repeat protein